jgi:hypothetical protein
MISRYILNNVKLKAIKHVIFFKEFLLPGLQVHIVYMGERPRGDFSAASMHHSMLERVLGRLLLLACFS